MGYPSDYDTIFEAQLLGSRGLAGKVSNRTIKAQDERFHDMQAQNAKAHKEFYDLVKSGEIIDVSGELTQAGILAKEKRAREEKIKSEIDTLKGKIKFIESLGDMSHMKNGSLRKNFKMQVDMYNNEIEKRQNEIN
jgi:hypothetical protein